MSDGLTSHAAAGPASRALRSISASGGEEATPRLHASETRAAPGDRDRASRYGHAMLKPSAASAALVLLAAASAVAADADKGVVEHKDGIVDSATSPLEDLNLRRIEIPGVLTRAVKNPYDMDGMDRCEQIAAEVGRLDEALGRDMDEPPPPDTRTKAQKAGAAVHDAAADGAKMGVDHFIPFRDWIRKLTGAERHDKKVQKAITAGRIRRGYLKGVGMRKNCAPPAAPSWFKPAPAEAPSAHKGFIEALAGFWASIVAWFQSWWPFR